MNNNSAIPSFMSAKQLSLLVKFGFDNMVTESNLENLLRRAGRMQRNSEQVHARARRRYFRNKMAKASRRANRGVQ